MKDAQLELATSNPDEEVLEFFVGDEDEETQAQQVDISSIDGPYVMVDLGAPQFKQVVQCGEYIAKYGPEIGYNTLLTLMREHEIVPVRWEKGWKFLKWWEARLWFTTLFDKHMIERWNIFPTDEEKKYDWKGSSRKKTQKNGNRKVDTK